MPRASKRTCRTFGCGALISREQYYCTPCRREREAIRGTRAQRGYDADHDRTRRDMMRRLTAAAAAGKPWTCPICGKFLLPTQQLELGHLTPLAIDPSSRDRAMMHATPCNFRGRHPSNYRRQV